jgi:HK97 family phage major capsid protein
MNDKTRDLLSRNAREVRILEPILANTHSTDRELDEAEAASDKIKLYKREARALGITLPDTVAELDRPVGEPVSRSGAEYSDGPQNGRAVRSDQRVSDLPSVPKTGIDMTRAFRGMILADWRGIEQRAIQNEGTGAAGQFLVNPELSSNVIDLVRAQSVMVKSGAQTIGEEGAQVPSLYLAKVLTDPTSQWIGEGVAQTPSSMTYSRIQLIPRVLTTMVEASYELLADSPTAMDTMVNSITLSLAAELDRVGLAGSGSGAQPQGLKGTKVGPRGRLAPEPPVSARASTYFKTTELRQTVTPPIERGVA